MRIRPGTPIQISLHWDSKTIMPVGRLAYRDRRAFLEYDQAFLTTGLQISPLHHETRAQLDPPYNGEAFEGLHGVFADSLPDGWGRLLVDRRARQLGTDPATLTPLDRLACVGRGGIGALTYAPVFDVWDDETAVLDLDQLAADAKRVLAGEVSDVIAALGKAGGSPGGARPKALIALNADGEAQHGTEEIPAGFEPFLVKFPGQDDPDDIAAIEEAYAQMARAAGIDMSQTRLIEGKKGERYFATRRFDRVNGGRLHVHSASGLLYSDFRIPALDYKDLIRLTRMVTRDRREAIKMFHLAIFNVLAHNRDDHARQFSFLMNRAGIWRLAPAYDLTFAAGPGGEHSTSVLGHGKNITRDHLLKLAGEADLNEKSASELIDRVATAIGEWRRFAADAGVTRKSASEIAQKLADVRVWV